EPAPLPLGETAPDAEPFIVAERVLQALCPHLAPVADPLRLPGGPPLLREERLRVSLRAQCPLLPLRRVAQQVQSGPDYAAIHTCVPPSDAPADSPAQPPHAEGVTFVPSRAVRTPPANDPTEITRV